MGALPEMYCTKCGRNNPDKNKFCNGCGAKFVAVEEPRRVSSEKEGSLLTTPPPPPPPPPPIQPASKWIVPLEPISLVEPPLQVDTPMTQAPLQSDFDEESKIRDEFIQNPDPESREFAGSVRAPATISQIETYENVQKKTGTGDLDVGGGGTNQAIFFDDVRGDSSLSGASPGSEAQGIADADKPSVVPLSLEDLYPGTVNAANEEKRVDESEALVKGSKADESETHSPGHVSEYSFVAGESTVYPRKPADEIEPEPTIKSLQGAELDVLSDSVPPQEPFVDLPVQGLSARNESSVSKIEPTYGGVIETVGDVPIEQPVEPLETDLLAETPDPSISVVRKRRRPSPRKSSKNKGLRVDPEGVAGDEIGVVSMEVHLETSGSQSVADGQSTQAVDEIPDERVEPSISQAVGSAMLEPHAQPPGDWSVTLDTESLGGVFEAAEARLDEVLVDVTQDDNIELRGKGLPAQPSVDFDQIELGSETTEDEAEPPVFPIREHDGGKLKLIVGGSAVLLISISAFFVWLGLREKGGTSEDGPASPTSKQDRSIVPPNGMAYVPGGEFMMGDDKGPKRARPAHRVNVDPFFMDLTEVTNEDYKRFIDATGHGPPPHWKNGTFAVGRERFPVNNVNWDDANAYAVWATKRLPTEEEWEFAARGTTGWKYPWGNNWKRGLSNAGTSGIQEVGASEGRSPFGIADMTGNVWEWTSSDYALYPGSSLEEPPYSGNKVIRGGSYASDRNNAVVSMRSPWGPRNDVDGYSGVGFRCVSEVIKSP